MSSEVYPEVAYRNFSIDEGYSYSFVISIDTPSLDSYTFTFTACESGSVNPAFVLTSTAGDITTGTLGLVEVAIPSSATDGAAYSQVIYDLVMTDEFAVSKSIIKGLITICPALD